MVLLRFGEMDFAMLLEHQMRIHKYNKINKLYNVDFIGHFISIWFYCIFSEFKDAPIATEKQVEQGMVRGIFDKIRTERLTMMYSQIGSSLRLT